VRTATNLDETTFLVERPGGCVRFAYLQKNGIRFSQPRQVGNLSQKTNRQTSSSTVGGNYDIFDLPFPVEHSSNKKSRKRGVFLQHRSDAIRAADGNFVLPLRPVGRARRLARKGHHGGDISEGSGADRQGSA